MIHETVPKDKERAGISAAELMFMLPSILMKGRKNAITSDEISRRINQNPTKTNRVIREACKRLLCGGGCPVISCNDGFFVAENVKELEEYRRSLESKIEGIGRDIHAVNNFIYREATPDAAQEPRT